MSNVGSKASHWILLGCFLFGILVFELGTRGLNEPDEGRYANIALEAIELDHPWWEPQLADVGHFDKPPLTYWISGLGYKIFGVNAWGARLPSLLGAMMTIGGLGWMAYRRYGSRVAWLSVLVAGTLLQIWLWGRILSCDMLLAGFCTLAIGAWSETKHRHGSVGWWLLQVLFWSLAGWTKATPALVPLLGLVIYVFIAGDREDRLALKLPALLPLIVAISLVWYAFILISLPALSDFFFHRELLQRVTGHIAGRRGPIYYYVPLCLLFWLPWWPLAMAALIRQRRSSDLTLNRWREWVSPGLCITLTGFCIFSLIGSKHATYLLPFAPWAALEFARLLVRDHRLSRTSVILPVAGCTALLYLVGISLFPAREGKMGLNSSLRGVAEILNRNHPNGIYCDHFWPSLEVYCGEKVYFTDGAPEETYDKSDSPAAHFGYENPKAQSGAWFIHFRKATDAPFRKWLSDPRIPKTVVGDFVIGPLEPLAPNVVSSTTSRKSPWSHVQR